MEITNRHNGGYFPFLPMGDGGSSPITEALNANLIALSGIIDQVMLERRAVGVTHLSPNDNTYFIATAVDLQKNPIYVPTLAELGFANGAYEVKAAIGVTAYDPTNGVPTIDIRLLNEADESVVSGFSTSKTLNGAGTDEFVQSEYATITPGKSYLIDFRTDAGKQARVRVYTLHLQIIKK